MKKLIYVAACAALTAVLFSGCQKAETPVVTELEPVGTTAPTQLPTERIDTAWEEITPPMSVEYAVDRFLAQKDSYAYFDDALDSEYAVKVAALALRDIGDVEFLTILADVDENGNLLCTQSRVLYTAEDMKETDLFVVNMEFVGAIPNRALRYTDAEGNAHIFGLGMSGEDGMPILIPIR